MTKNPLRADPTHTTQLRLRFAADLRRRFDALGRDVKDLVVKEDAFGLVENTRWRFETNENKLRSFRGWLRYQTAQRILGTDAEQPERPWTAQYVFSAYQRGAQRAIDDARQGNQKSAIWGGLIQGAVREEQLRLLYLRSFEDLQGISYQMSVQMSKVLASGLVQGLNPRAIARELSEQVGLSRNRSLLISQTEVIRSHAEGQLDAFDRMGIEKVGALVESLTAGDGRVCPKCRDLSTHVFTVAQARGRLPVHPRCRCCWSPHLEVAVASEEPPARRQRLSAAVRRSA